MTNEFLNLTGVSKSFAGVHALQDADLTIENGRIHCLVGENGSGKSTLIKVIAGVYQRDKGTIKINGKEFERLQPIDAIREGIQVIYQDFSLFPNLTVAENIALNAELRDGRRFVNWRHVNLIAAHALEQLGVKIPLDALVMDVSVADKQLIAIARALRQQAQLIIMDEPTTALTEREVRSLFSVVRKLQEQENIAFLFVSHKLDEVLEISETIIVIRNGQIISVGNREEYDYNRLIYEMTGHDISDKIFYYDPDLSKPPLLRVENLNTSDILKDINFELRGGEIVGITGLLGSGRTELALALYGMYPIESGKIYINDKAVTFRSNRDAIAHGIGYVPEDRLTEGLFLDQSIGRNVVVRIIEELRTRFGLTDPQEIDNQVNHWVDALSIKTSDPDLPAKTLSGGNQQRVVLAKWLASNPQIMILNGPTVGVDVGSKEELHDLMKELADNGMGLLVISDDTRELLKICNRILLMRNGRISVEIEADDINEDKLASMLIED
jgi:simple sugar transport system ATP-binding protein